MEGWQCFLLGMLGGLIPEAVAFYNLRKTYDPEKHYYIKRWFYWIPTILMILFGGGLAAIYNCSGASLNVMASIHIGAATPVILTNMTNKAPKIN